MKVSLQESYYRFSSDLVCLVDDEGIIVECNELFLNFFSASGVSIIGSPIVGVIELDNKTHKGCDHFTDFVALPVKDSSIVDATGIVSWFSWQVFQMKDDHQWLVVGRDITTHKKVQLDLDERRWRYLLATRAAGDGIWDWNIMDNTVYYSSTWKSQIGYTPEELPNEFETWQRLLHPDDYQDTHASLYAFLDRPGPILEMEFRLRHKNGSYRWISYRASSILDANGRPTRMLGVHRDITEQKELREDLLKLQRAVIQSPVPITITDLDGTIEFVNPKFCELTGYAQYEVVGKNPRIVKSGCHDHMFYQKMWDLISRGNEWKGQIINRRKNGEIFIEQATISPITAPNGKMLHYMKISEDITKRVQMEEELHEAKQRAEVANIYKNNFLANMSHEIRTPMNGIIGFSELLKEPDLTDPDKYRYIQIINDNCGILLNLIDDIIDISKIEANEIKIQHSRFNLNGMLQELQEFYHTYQKNFRKEHIEIRISIPDSPQGFEVETDPIRLRQILTNLINNALKFIMEGYVEIGFTQHDDKSLLFYVRDTGIGIPKDAQEMIFERFRQMDESLTRKYGGTGLGLAITKGLVKILGGDIWLESEPDQGSTFYFTLQVQGQG